MPFTESDIKNYRCHADAVIAEIYPLLKNAVSPHAATYMKKDMLRLKENGLDERMTLEENKTFFHEIATCTVMPQLPPRSDTATSHTALR